MRLIRNATDIQTPGSSSSGQHLQNITKGDQDQENLILERDHKPQYMRQEIKILKAKQSIQ